MSFRVFLETYASSLPMCKSVYIPLYVAECDEQNISSTCFNLSLEKVAFVADNDAYAVIMFIDYLNEHLVVDGQKFDRFEILEENCKDFPFHMYAVESVRSIMNLGDADVWLEKRVIISNGL